jgi:hypothetical protein
MGQLYAACLLHLSQAPQGHGSVVFESYADGVGLCSNVRGMLLVVSELLFALVQTDSAAVRGSRRSVVHGPHTFDRVQYEPRQRETCRAALKRTAIAAQPQRRRQEGVGYSDEEGEHYHQIVPLSCACGSVDPGKSIGCLSCLSNTKHFSTSRVDAIGISMASRGCKVNLMSKLQLKSSFPIMRDNQVCWWSQMIKSPVWIPFSLRLSEQQPTPQTAATIHRTANLELLHQAALRFLLSDIRSFPTYHEVLYPLRCLPVVIQTAKRYHGTGY